MKYSNASMKTIIELSPGGGKSGEDTASIRQMSCTGDYRTSSALVSALPSSPANEPKDEVIVESPGGTIYLDGLLPEDSKGNPNMPVLNELVTPPSVEKELVRKPDTLVDLDELEPDRKKVKTSTVSYGKRLKFVVEELEKEVTTLVLQNGMTFVDRVYTLISTLRSAALTIIQNDWKVQYLNRRGFEDLFEGDIAPDVMEDMMHIFNNVRVKSGYGDVVVSPVEHAAEGSSGKEQFWDIVVIWPNRIATGEAGDLIEDFTPSPLCAEIDELDDAKLINGVIATSLKQLSKVFGVACDNIKKRHPNSKVLQQSFLGNLNTATKAIKNFPIRVDFLTKKGVIKHIDGLGEVTFERIQNILQDGPKEKMWGCTYNPPSRNGQPIVVHVDWIEKND